MNTFEFLAYLRSVDVRLSAAGEQLHLSAPKGVLTPALRAELAERKKEILTVLDEADQAKPYTLPPISPSCRVGNLPLSFAQQRLWFFVQLEPGTPTYNVVTAFQLKGLLNVTVLEQSLAEMGRRHEILRATFVAIDGKPYQIIAPDMALTLPIVDLRSLPALEREAAAQRLIVEEARQLFDLTQGPLLRVKLLRLAETEHKLLLTMHHLVSDGWSLEIFFRELSVLYKAYGAGQSSPLPELPIQYADFVVWQRRWLQGEVLEPQLDYWKRQLQEPLPVLELPTDHPRPAVQTYQGACQSLMLPTPLTETLKSLSGQAGCTLFMTLLTAFKILLYRYTGQTDIIVGVPIAGRNQLETEGLIGCFVNTLVIRSDLCGNPTFRALLARIREVVLAAFAHQDLPFEKLVEKLQPERTLNHSPLFQVMFQYLNDFMSTLMLTDLTVSPLEIDTGTAKFDLSLFIIERAEGLRVAVEYNTDLFETSTITRLLGHFQTLLAGIGANPDEGISNLPLLAETERYQLLITWNNTQASYPQEVCLHQLFEAQVEQTPDAVAMIFPSTNLGHGEDSQLTYRELNRRANQLAHRLQALGVGPEVLVGLYLERSPEMVVGLLGVLKAGGAYIPLDLAYPPARLAFMLDDARPAVLLTQQRLMARLPHYKGQIITIDLDGQDLVRQSAENPASGVTADNLAYVIYTSGSTGQPKGVMISHRAICNHMHWMQATFPLTETDRVLQKTPFSFDASVWEFYAPLLVGGQLILTRPGAHQDSAYLVQLMAAYQVTHLKLVPALLQMLLAEPEFERCYYLRRVFCGGEVLPVELQERFFTRLGAELYNLYGPTEACIDATYWTCRPDPQQRRVPIGRPIANTQVYLLDPHLQPVPIGVPGELHIGGTALGRGYLNRPELTGEKFIPNPFSDEPGACLYKTGDLARYLPDGAIEFLGRIDHQVKIRGVRIELGEVEAVLAQHPAVRESLVTVREDAPGDKRLVAYVVPGQEPVPVSSELRAWLKEKLPDYMLPSAFVLLDALPLTPNGKVDRHTLPRPHQTRLEPEATFAVPCTPAEEVVASICSQVLGVKRIGLHDNFFELGGHSLLAIQVVSRLYKFFRVELPLLTLFEQPTVFGLVNVLAQIRGGREVVEEIARTLQELEQLSADEVTIMLSTQKVKERAMPLSSLVCVQSSGSRLPFFCIPGNLGNIFTDLGDLARHLGPDRPFYAFQDGIHNPAGIKALACHYLHEIQTVQSEGPYFLGGVCAGAVIAFEMAQQLQAQGQPVGLLALVEPSAPRPIGLRPYLNFALLVSRRILQRFSRHSHNMMQFNFTERGNYLRLKAKLVANSWALVRYVPQSYPGKIHLFVTEGSLNPPHARLGWRELAAGGTELHVMPGTHAAITHTHEAVPEETHLQVLAEQLRACLDDALATSGFELENKMLALRTF